MSQSGRFRVAAAQVECVTGDVARNLETIVDAIARARSENANLVVFPELALTGADLEGRILDVARDLESPELQTLAEASTDITTIVGFVEEAADSRFFNSVVCFEDGCATHVHRKLYLVTYGTINEGRLFARGTTVDAFDTRVGRLATPICEDTWHIPVPYLAALDGAQILITCAGSPEGLIAKTVPSAQNWAAVLRAHAITLGCFHVFVNRAGIEGSLSFWGGSMVFGPTGELIAATTSSEAELVVADIDLAEVRKQRFAAPFLRDERVDLTLRELERISGRRNGTG